MTRLSTERSPLSFKGLPPPADWWATWSCTSAVLGAGGGLGPNWKGRREVWQRGFEVGDIKISMVYCHISHPLLHGYISFYILHRRRMIPDKNPKTEGKNLLPCQFMLPSAERGCFLLSAWILAGRLSWMQSIRILSQLKEEKYIGESVSHWKQQKWVSD